MLSLKLFCTGSSIMSGNLQLNTHLNSNSQNSSTNDNASVNSHSTNTSKTTEQKLASMETPLSRFLAGFETVTNRGVESGDQEKEYTDLRSKVSEFFKNNPDPNATYSLSADDMNVILKITRIRIRRDGWNWFNAYDQFSTGKSDIPMFYGHGKRLFSYDDNVYRGTDLNYIMVGMRASFYNMGPILRNIMVSGYNAVQGDTSQISPLSDAAYWSSQGASYIENWPIRYE
jgi:hypothetical protein